MKLAGALPFAAWLESHPARGAWIEMPPSKMSPAPPRGAPRKGCVDRNVACLGHSGGKRVAPRKGCVD